jgi:hypothetical protein
MQSQLASASPPQRGRKSKSRQSKSLAAFCMFAKYSLSKKPILLSSRRVSTTRNWERFARALRPSTTPTETRSRCLRGEVVSGTTRQASEPNPRKMTHGRTNHLPRPSCSVPTFTPRRHHHTSRTVYRRDFSASVFFLMSFQASQFFSIARRTVYREFSYFSFCSRRCRNCAPWHNLPPMNRKVKHYDPGMPPTGHQVSPERLEAFRRIYEEVYEEEISTAEASAMTHQLLALYRLLSLPWPSELSQRPLLPPTPVRSAAEES